MKTLKLGAIIPILFACWNLEAQEKMFLKPNIIYILADDLGINDLGCYGQKKIETPQIDKMANEGIRFTQHYSGSPVCAPSRGVLMTGLHTGNAYIKGNFAMENEGNLPLPEKTVTVGNILQSNGYKTGVIGKWGLGGPDDQGHPNNQGFDFSFCYLDQRLAHEYYPEHLWRNFEKITLENKNSNQKDYSHDLFTKEALKFITENKNNPFFLYLPYTIPHGKYQVPDNSLYEKKPWNEREKNYAAMISRMDNDMGRLFSLLDSLGLDENTIVFFSSDNGGTKGVGDFFQSNSPFRGYKTDLYEGGIRVPLIVRWPGKIEANAVTDHQSAFWDVLPTICDIIGTKTPDKTDGISFLPALLNQPQDEHKFLYWEYFHYNYGWEPGSASLRNHLESQAVRFGEWKGIRKNMKNNLDTPIELYNLSNDIGEKKNVSVQFPGIVKQIKKIMETEHTDSEFFRIN